jgi:phosphoenolpyruvate synthase/pyruvate phosphate dikinase
MKFFYFWKNRKYPPFLMNPVVTGTVDFKKIYPKSTIVCGGNRWINGVSDYFYEESGMEKTVRFFAMDSLNSPEIFFEIFKKALEKSKNLRIYVKKLEEKGIKNLSSQELIKILKDFNDRFYQMYIYASAQSFMGYREDSPLYKMSESILRKKFKNNPEKISQYSITLTNPPKKLKNKDFDLEIINLAEKCLSLKPESARKLAEEEYKKIIEKFSWLFFDFTDKNLLNTSLCRKLVKEKIKLGRKDIMSAQENINNYNKITNNDFIRACRELKLNKKEIKVFELIKWLGYFKWAREYEFQEACFGIKRFQDELGKRFGLKTIETKYLFSEDFKTLNIDQLKKLARARIKDSLFIYSKEGGVFLTGKEAREKFAELEFVEEKINKDTKEIKGSIAQPGKARGKVKIINFPKDMTKMSKGDILVSISTNPGIVSAMKKAAAIITDEGGITCHAAIVSRELKIPCVVGTKFATKILKNGDLVEVDADNGVVRILK